MKKKHRRLWRKIKKEMESHAYNTETLMQEISEGLSSEPTRLTEQNRRLAHDMTIIESNICRIFNQLEQLVKAEKGGVKRNS